MPINITDRWPLNQYETYAVDRDRLKQKLQQADQKNTAVTGNDTVDISKAGRNALENKMSTFVREGQMKDKDVKMLSMVSSFTIMNDFERAVSAERKEGVKSNTFDCHINQMVSAYDHLMKKIEEKYADPDREQQYYVADDGSIQALTKEKEVEMLHKAYEKHSKFMAVTTEIWRGMHDFKPQTIYQSNRADTVQQSVSTVDIGKGMIQEQAYQAFMSAVDLRFDISAPARNELNRIWDHFLLFGTLFSCC